MSTTVKGWCLVCNAWKRALEGYSIIKSQRAIPVGTAMHRGCETCGNLTIDNYPMNESLWADRRTGETVLTHALLRTEEGEWVHPEEHRTEGEPNVLFSGKHGAVSYTLKKFYHRFKPMIGKDPLPPTTDIRIPSDPDRSQTEMNMSSDDDHTESKPESKPEPKTEAWIGHSDRLGEDATPAYAFLAHMKELQKKKQLRIYIAGPLNSSGLMSVNIRKAIMVGAELRHWGELPFIPHLFWFAEFLLGIESEDFWLKWDFEELKKCDVLIRLPGKSNGSDQEVKVAEENNIPIFYGLVSFLDWRGIAVSERYALKLEIYEEWRTKRLAQQEEAAARLKDIRERHGHNSGAELSLWREAEKEGYPIEVEGFRNVDDSWQLEKVWLDDGTTITLRICTGPEFETAFEVAAAQCVILPPFEMKMMTLGQLVQDKPSIGYSMSMDEAAPIIQEAFGSPPGDAVEEKRFVLYSPEQYRSVEDQLKHLIDPLQHKPLPMWVQALVPLVETVFASGASALSINAEAFTASGTKADQISARFKIGAEPWRGVQPGTPMGSIKDVLRSLAGRVRKDASDLRMKGK